MRNYPILFLALSPLLAQAPPPLSLSPLSLSLKSAVDFALAPEGNTRVQIAAELIHQAEARSGQARASLLPDLSGTLTEQSQTRNLAAVGIQIHVPIPGFQFPEFVGPFSIFDARASVAQSIFDFAAIRRFQASKTGIELAKAENESTRNQVADQVARLYASAVRSQAVLESAQSNVKLAEALLTLAENQKAAGTGTGIEVTRAKVQLANERQNLQVAEIEQTSARLELLRTLGMKLDTRIELADPLAYKAAEISSVDPALDLARRSRPELKAQNRREENSRLTYDSVKYERLPSLSGFADYGAIGTGIDHALPTRTYGVQMRVPIFDGGRRDARRAESLSTYRQEKIHTRDVREQVELDVRLAIEKLQSAEGQVKTAEEGLSLAENELAQAERRYKAGVATNIEVTDAQTRLARARSNRIAALFNHNLARIDLGTATGTIQQMVGR